MNPAEIIKEATADGVNLTLSPAGKIKASGNQDAVNRWLPLISENKTSILTTLQKETELRKLILHCGKFYGFTEADYAEATQIGLADLDSALVCYRSIAAKHVQPIYENFVSGDGTHIEVQR